MVARKKRPRAKSAVDLRAAIMQTAYRQAAKLKLEDRQVPKAVEHGLDEADPQKLREAFEENPEVFVSRVIVTQNQLCDSGRPFYTFEELLQITQKFIKYLKKNRDHLIQTGFPSLPFKESCWLDWHLGKNYYTRSVLPPPGELSGFLWEKWPGYPWRNNRPPKLEIMQAAIVEELTPSDVEYLEGIREQVLELKTRTLEMLASCRRDSSTAKLWRDFQYFVEDTIGSEDEQKLIGIDRRLFVRLFGDKRLIPDPSDIWLMCIITRVYATFITLLETIWWKSKLEEWTRRGRSFSDCHARCPIITNRWEKTGGQSLIRC